MSLDPTAMGYPMPGAQVFELLVGLEIDEAAAGSPRLGPGAPWVRRLPDALARADAAAADYARVLVTVTAVYPLVGDPRRRRTSRSPTSGPASRNTSFGRSTGRRGATCSVASTSARSGSRKARSS